MAGGLIVLAVTALHLPALLGGSYFLDVYLTEVHPNTVEIGRQLANGHLPLWTDRIALGYPLASNPQVGVFYPPHLLGVLVLDAERLIPISAWLHCLLAAFGVFFLARKSGTSHAGGTAAALIFACCPFVVFYHQAIHGLVALAWMPWILLVTWIAAERRALGWWALGAVLLALQMYAGHLQFVAYTLVATVLVAWLGAGKPRMAFMCVAQGAVALLLYAPQLFAAFVLWRQSLRRSLSPADVSASMDVESLGLDDLVELILPNWFGGPRLTDFWYPEFVGAAVVVLAIIGWRRSRLFSVMLLAAVAYLTLIRLPVVGEWVLSIPGLSAFRAPGRLLCWILLALAILCGHGIDAARRERWEAIPLGIFAVIGLLTVTDSDGQALLLACVGLGVAWWLKRPWLLAAAAVLPLMFVGARYLPVTDAPSPGPAVKVLKQRAFRVLGVSAGDPAYLSAVPGPDGWPNRPGAENRAGWTLPSNVGMAHGLRNLHAQTSLPLARFVARILGPQAATLAYPPQEHPAYDQRLLEHLGVSHVVNYRHGQMPLSPRPATIAEKDLIVVHALIPRHPARFYPMSEVRSVATRDEALAAVKRVGPAPDVPLILEGPGGQWTGTSMAQPTPIVQRTPWSVSVDAPSDGVLLLAASWYPNWRVTVDGQPAELLVADGCLMGVKLSAGRREVALQYVPTDFLWGLGFMGLGWLLIAAAGWHSWLHARRGSKHVEESGGAA